MIRCKHLGMVASTMLHASSQCIAVDRRTGKNACGKEREENGRIKSLAERWLNSCNIIRRKVLESVEFGFGDGGSPFLCALNTSAFREVEGKGHAQIVLEEKINGRRNGRVRNKCIRLLNWLEIICLQILEISESEISNRGHVTLGEVDDDEKTSLQEEIEYPQHDTGTGDFAVPFGPPLQYILNSHITSHLCSWLEWEDTMLYERTQSSPTSAQFPVWFAYNSRNEETPNRQILLQNALKGVFLRFQRYRIE